MDRRGLLLRAVACLLAAVLGSCASAEPDAGGPPSPAADAPRAGVEELCAAVADAYDLTLEAEDLAGLEDADAEVREAEGELAEGLRDLDASPELDAYLEELERYSAAGTRVTAGIGGGRKTLEATVEAARSGIRLEEAAAEAGLPEECPPPPGVDVENTLFVTKANLGCFDLGEDVASAGPIEAPKTPEEIALVLELAQRLTVGIAREVEQAAGPGVATELPVKQIVRLSKKRFHAIRALAATFDEGDYGAYRKAGRRLVEVSREADRKMESIGLFQCSKAFGLIPL